MDVLAKYWDGKFFWSNTENRKQLNSNEPKSIESQAHAKQSEKVADTRDRFDKFIGKIETFNFTPYSSKH